MLRTIFAICVVGLVACVILTAVNGIGSAKIDSWLNRAKGAGNPAQVAEFLGNYEGSLYQANRVEGKYASVFKYPGTYMPTYLRTIDGLIERAKALAVQDATQTSYQMGLVNLEKDLGDIESAAWAVWFANGGWIAVWGIVVFLFPAMIIGVKWAAEFM
jgi:hypothetical protein